MPVVLLFLEYFSDMHGVCYIGNYELFIQFIRITS